MASRFEEEKNKAYEKALKKSRKKAAKKAAQEAERRKRQVVINYADDGTRIGDDGLYMTKARKKLHRTYDLIIIWMAVTFFAAAGCIIASFFQNQTITEWELIWIGGNMFNGLPVANILRIEALFMLYVCAVSLFTNQKGMAWMYDHRPKKPAMITCMLLLIPSAIYFVGFFFIVGLPEPVSAISIVLALCVYFFIPPVERERPSLKKVKVARSEIK